MTSHNTAPNQFVELGDVRYAYRRFGRPGGTPILLLQHFIGTMDWWDPLLTDGLAKTREVILFDNRGVGLTSGETPNRIAAMAADVHAFIHALGLAQVDVLAFSIGGFVGQELALTYPDDVRKLILAGTGPRGGQGMQAPRQDVVDALSLGDHSKARAYLFFSQSENGQAEAKAFLARTGERKRDLDPESSIQTMQAQSEAIGEWGLLDSHTDFLAKLRTLEHPTLVVNGNDDIMVATPNSYTLAQAIPKAQLVIYPDSGHGALFQYADLLVQHINLFLDQSDI